MCFSIYLFFTVKITSRLFLFHSKTIYNILTIFFNCQIYILKKKNDFLKNVETSSKMISVFNSLLKTNNGSNPNSHFGLNHQQILQLQQQYQQRHRQLQLGSHTMAHYPLKVCCNKLIIFMCPNNLTRISTR